MPISIQKIKEFEIHNILSSTKEDLEKLTDIELTTISDIITWNKENRKSSSMILNLLNLVHWLIMDYKHKEKRYEDFIATDKIKNESDKWKILVQAVDEIKKL